MAPGASLLIESDAGLVLVDTALGLDDMRLSEAAAKRLEPVIAAVP